ncbi:hypothetical protein WI40_14545 [Burkholderia ubonensis]|nr:hypothetical protein WI31_22230 [Burkholderia ubonensis]KUZ11813.1 hypothetical protein WI29_28390 [Burkholderia ubonensis]KUZ35752.1 hypothetical protein WI30_11730 [Burkholderia ubonensis]KUZ39281.1 hypothetical protein WI32_11770 [Burkholderia ubonensis]KUZ45741.1 hypothetical protein WI33_27510 [Burkholderia ubonensis]
MKLPYEWQIGLRYTRVGKRTIGTTGNGFISFIAVASMSGIALGVAALTFLLSALATLYPSWRSARVRPADALRYE